MSRDTFPDQIRLCEIEGCGRKHAARGWCHRHYDIWRTNGDPLARQRHRGTPEERFDHYTPNRGEGCWDWNGPMHHSGYGFFSVDGRHYQPHRFSYERFVGPIPDGLQIDHLCRNRACVNPAHLEPVTQLENMRRGNGYGAVNSRKTHCPQGHPYTPDNIYPERTNRGTPARRCKACHNQRTRDRHRRRAAEKRAAA